MTLPLELELPVPAEIPGPQVPVTLTVVAYGTPAPQGSHKAFVVGNRAIVTNDSKKTQPWRNTVAIAVQDALPDGWQPLDGPLAVRMVFTLPKPVSAPKRRRTWPCRKPDWDKLARATSDALSDAGAYVDDARVIEAAVLKVFPGEHPEALNVPGVVITLWPVTG